MAVFDSAVVFIASLSLVTGIGTNVAENKPAWMSSIWKSNQPASTAVDGVILAHDYKYSAVTKPGEMTGWWKVDLQTQVQSALVTLYFSTYYKPRRNGVQLYTSMTNSSDPKEGNLCHSVTGRFNGTEIPDVLNVTCPGTWHYLTGYTETDNDGYGPLLDFVEVQVWTCSVGIYGVNCNKNCNSRHCSGSPDSCDSMTGACPSGQCQTGWAGTDCAACAVGIYGVNCNKNCNSRHCSGSPDSCDSMTGACSSGQCQTGWAGTDCAACSVGIYGVNCNKNCNSRHCSGSPDSCDSMTGACPSGQCQTGWAGTDCAACSVGIYGVNCNKNCNSRHCSGSPDSCDSMTGACPSGQCQTGWAGTDCAACAVGIYGVNCNKNCNSRHCSGSPDSCDSMTGACSSGQCQTGWAGTDCAGESIIINKLDVDDQIVSWFDSGWD
ncbi:multiple epidermal growth factor-like domains protein 11 [Haliotis rufescens]|uniref:multiple epidermal growth factor-like domains protein 11 n=1 Tax=Haliotis rufescens TaxID=6454 RepID=UPI00201F94ED|nr:multiple epidermal growth factor-like domains protein 11 [Haliotis rufescens]